MRVRRPEAPIAAAVWALEQVNGAGDWEIGRIAGAQKGYVVREQLAAAGIRRGAIAHRVKSGRLRIRYPGVYGVGHDSTDPLGEEMAAVLNFRGHAILSHRSAAAIWGFARRDEDEVMLTIVARQTHSRPGLRLFRAADLDRRDLRARDGLPVTSPARTAIDLAAVLEDDDELEQAMGEAHARGLLTEAELAATLRRAGPRKGVARLRRLAAGEDGYTRSKGERMMRGLLRAADLPQPHANAPLLGYRADFLWEAERLIVEVDGHLFHSSRAAFERDRRRDQRFVAAGYRVIRVTWRQLCNEPIAVAARIAQALVHRP